MKALTLTQPWASLIMLGAKTVETRSWNTSHRGPIAIHAGKTMPCRRGERLIIGEFTVERDAAGLLLRGPLAWLYRLPLGAVLGKVTLTGTGPTETLTPDPYGDYSPGRFGWSLTDVERLAKPSPMSGALGLWNAPFVNGPTECIDCDTPIVFGEFAAWNCDGEAYHARHPSVA